MWAPGVLENTAAMLSTAVMMGASVLMQRAVVLLTGLAVFSWCRRWGPHTQMFVLRLFLVITLCATVCWFAFPARLVMVPVPVISHSGSQSPNPQETVVPGAIDLYPVPATVQPEGNIAFQPELSTITGNSFLLHDPYLKAVPPEPGYEKKPASKQTANVLHQHTWRETFLPVLMAGFMLVWLGLSLILLLRTVSEYISIRALRKRAYPAPPEIARQSGRLAESLGIDSPRVFQAPHLISPLLTGIRKPAILLPAFREMQDLRISETLIHELTHHRNHDLLWNHVCRVALICLPVQPLLWVFARKLDETSDYVCDAAVVAHTRDRRSYATTLFDIAREYQEVQHDLTFGIGFVSSISPLRRRIERILRGTFEFAPRLSIRFIAFVTILGMASGTVTGLVGFQKSVLPGLPGLEANQAFAFLRAAVLNNIEVPQPEIIFIEATGVPEQGNRFENDVAVLPGGSADNQESNPEVSPAVQDNHDELSGANEYSVLPGKNQLVPATAEIPGSGEVYGIAASTDESGAVRVGQVFNAHDRLIAADVQSGPDGYSDPNEISAFLTSQRGNGLPVVRGYTRIGVPVAKAVPVTIPDYQGRTFDLADASDAREYNLYQSLDKYKNEPAWSPDGLFIAFTDRNRIWMVSSTGGEPRLIYENFQEQDGRQYPIGGIESLSFTPDGRKLLFKQDFYDQERGSAIIIREGGEGIWSACFSDPVFLVMLFDLETGTVSEVADNAYHGVMSRTGRYICWLTGPAPSKTGESIRAELPVLFDLKTGEKRILDSREGWRYGKPAFSPDEQSLIIPGRDNNGPIELFNIPLAGGEPEKLTTYNPSTGYGKYLNYPAISPDGNWVLYTDFTIAPGRPDKRLFLYSTVSGERFDMYPASDVRLAYGVWSPDGQNICYLAEEPAGNAIYLCRFEPRLFPIHKPAVPETAEAPLAFSLNPPYPNPFNSAASIPFSIPVSERVTLDIYNITGQLVRRLADDTFAPGAHSVAWDGRDEHGSGASSGVYLIRLAAGGEVATAKMTLAR